jgi:prephenate dehydrogenase
MNEPGFTTGRLAGCQVAIWGLGLMGGSLALALRGKVAGLVGVDNDPAAVRLALQLGVVDKAILFSAQPAPQVESLAAALRGIHLVILAAPVQAILHLLSKLPELISGKAVIMDIGSTKECIVKAMENLPERFDPVGGHPMCGKEQTSLQAAEADLFHSAPFALVRMERTSAKAQSLAEELVRAVGANALWMEAEVHDRWVAATSHVPFLLAEALVQSAPLEAAPLVGPGFRGTSRLAGSSPRMMVDILSTNRENIRTALGKVRAALDEYDRLLAREDYPALAELLQTGVERQRFFRGGG